MPLLYQEPPPITFVRHADVWTLGVGSAAEISFAEAAAARATWAGSAVSLAEPWDAKLDLMYDLDRGWDGYEADPPAPAVIEAARILVAHLEAAGVPPTRVAPSVVGGVGLTRAAVGRLVYLELYNDGGGHAIFSGDAEPVTFAFDLTPDGFRRAAGKARTHLNG